MLDIEKNPQPKTHSECANSNLRNTEMNSILNPACWIENE